MDIIQQFLNEKIGILFNGDRCGYDWESFVAKKKPLITIGLSGAGKSTIGAAIAKSMNCPYIEEDEEERVYDPEYNNTDGSMPFPENEVQYLYWDKINSTIRISNEIGKYKVGGVYIIKSGNIKRDFMRLVVTKVENGPLKDWVRRGASVKDIMKEYGVSENEPSEFISFDKVRFSISKSITSSLSKHRFFVYEGLKMSYLHADHANKFRRTVNVKKYAFVILNTSLVVASWKAFRREGLFDLDLWNRFSNNKLIRKNLIGFEKMLDKSGLTKEKLSTKELIKDK